MTTRSARLPPDAAPGRQPGPCCARPEPPSDSRVPGRILHRRTSTPCHSSLFIDFPDPVERSAQPTSRWHTSIKLRRLKGPYRPPYSIQRHEVPQPPHRPQHQRRYAFPICNIGIETVPVDANVPSETSPDFVGIGMNYRPDLCNSHYARHGASRIYPNQRSRPQSDDSVPQFHGLVAGENQFRILRFQRDDRLTHDVPESKARSTTRHTLS